MRPFFAFLLGVLVSCYIMWMATLIVRGKDYIRNVYMDDGTRCVAYSLYRGDLPWKAEGEIAISCDFGRP